MIVATKQIEFDLRISMQEKLLRVKKKLLTQNKNLDFMKGSDTSQRLISVHSL